MEMILWARMISSHKSWGRRDLVKFVCVASSDIWGSILSRTMQQLIIGEQTEKIVKFRAQARVTTEMLKEQSKILAIIRGTLPQRDNISPRSKAPSLGSNEEVVPSSNQSPLKVKATVFVLSIRDPTTVVVTTQWVLPVSLGHIPWAKIGVRLISFSHIAVKRNSLDHTLRLQRLVKPMVLLLCGRLPLFLGVTMNFLKWTSCSGGCLVRILWHFLYSLFMGCLEDIWRIILLDTLYYLSLCYVE